MHLKKKGFTRIHDYIIHTHKAASVTNPCNKTAFPDLSLDFFLILPTTHPPSTYTHQYPLCLPQFQPIAHHPAASACLSTREQGGFPGITNCPARSGGGIFDQRQQQTPWAFGHLEQPWPQPALSGQLLNMAESFSNKPKGSALR